MTVTTIPKRYLWIGSIFLALVGLLVFTAAPATNRLNSGSTWNRAPDGYGAWYAYMVDQGAPIQRWQRPAAELLATVEQQDFQAPATLIQVQPHFTEPQLSSWQASSLGDWLAAGHRVIVLGQKETVTAAPFSKALSSDQGGVRVETRRRLLPSQSSGAILLGDDYGAVVWQHPQEAGSVILGITPFLAANAYEAEAGNFAFLKQLAIADGGPIWVDEYLHGYKDSEVMTTDTGSPDSWLHYLARTPWLIAWVQVGLVVAVGVMAQNRRPGVKQVLKSPAVDNSQAYIQAMAGILHKAASHDFVIDMLSRDERLALQKTLGLGVQAVADEVLAAAWSQRTGQPVSVLGVITQQVKLSQERDLETWLSRLHHLHQVHQARKSAHE